LVAGLLEYIRYGANRNQVDRKWQDAQLGEQATKLGPVVQISSDDDFLDFRSAHGRDRTCNRLLALPAPLRSGRQREVMLQRKSQARQDLRKTRSPRLPMVGNQDDLATGKSPLDHPVGQQIPPQDALGEQCEEADSGKDQTGAAREFAA